MDNPLEVPAHHFGLSFSVHVDTFAALFTYSCATGESMEKVIEDAIKSYTTSKSLPPLSRGQQLTLDGMLQENERRSEEEWGLID